MNCITPDLCGKLGSSVAMFWGGPLGMWGFWPCQWINPLISSQFVRLLGGDWNLGSGTLLKAVGLSLSAFCLPGGKLLCSLPWCSASLRLKMTGAKWHGLKSLDLWAKVGLSSSVDFLRHFVSVMKGWQTHQLMGKRPLWIFSADDENQVEGG
jgi:hypothetical protein